MYIFTAMKQVKYIWKVIKKKRFIMGLILIYPLNVGRISLEPFWVFDSYADDCLIEIRQMTKEFLILSQAFIP